MKKGQTKILAFGSILAVLVLAAAAFVGINSGAFASKAASNTASTSGGTDLKPLNYKGNGVSDADVAIADLQRGEG